MSRTKVSNRRDYSTSGTIYFELDGKECELDAQTTPVDEYCTPLFARAGDKVVIAYLVQDTDPSAPDDWDGEGKILRHDRWSRNKEIDEALGFDEDGHPQLEYVATEHLETWVLAPARRKEVLRWLHACKRPWNVPVEEWTNPTGNWLVKNYTEYDITDMAWRELNDRYNWPPSDNSSSLFVEWYRFALDKWVEMRVAGEIGVKYAVPLDVYDHGGIHVSIMNTTNYPDQQWDVSHGGAAWIPDQPAIDNIDWPEYVAKDTPEEHAARALRYAAGCIDTWNMYFSGDVYAHVVETHEFNEDGEYGSSTFVEDDTCWGHYGHDYAKEELQREFDSAVESLSKETA